MKKVKIWVQLLLAIFLFSGCVYAANTEKPLVRVVTKIHISYENGPIHTEHTFTREDKLQKFLNYLRSIRPYGKPKQDPEAVQGSIYRITVYHSDGYQKRYLQKADLFMKIEDGEWKIIDSGKAKALGDLLGRTESDVNGAD
jgi:hypothetical protein